MVRVRGCRHVGLEHGARPDRQPALVGARGGDEVRLRVASAAAGVERRHAVHPHHEVARADRGVRDLGRNGRGHAGIGASHPGVHEAAAARPCVLEQGIPVGGVHDAHVARPRADAGHGRGQVVAAHGDRLARAHGVLAARRPREIRGDEAADNGGQAGDVRHHVVLPGAPDIHRIVRAVVGGDEGEHHVVLREGGDAGRVPLVVPVDVVARIGQVLVGHLERRGHVGDQAGDAPVRDLERGPSVDREGDGVDAHVVVRGAAHHHGARDVGIGGAVVVGADPDRLDMPGHGGRGPVQQVERCGDGRDIDGRVLVVDVVDVDLDGLLHHDADRVGDLHGEDLAGPVTAELARDVDGSLAGGAVVGGVAGGSRAHDRVRERGVHADRRGVDLDVQQVVPGRDRACGVVRGPLIRVQRVAVVIEVRADRDARDDGHVVADEPGLLAVHEVAGIVPRNPVDLDVAIGEVVRIGVELCPPGHVRAGLLQLHGLGGPVRVPVDDAFTGWVFRVVPGSLGRRVLGHEAASGEVDDLVGGHVHKVHLDPVDAAHGARVRRRAHELRIDVPDVAMDVHGRGAAGVGGGRRRIVEVQGDQPGVDVRRRGSAVLHLHGHAEQAALARAADGEGDLRIGERVDRHVEPVGVEAVGRGVRADQVGAVGGAAVERELDRCDGHVVADARPEAHGAAARTGSRARGPTSPRRPG